MSKFISAILGQPERQTAKMIAKLEDKNGYSSHDARHLAENIQQIRLKLTELELDPDDTTAEELYHALRTKFDKDCRSFDIENNFHALEFGQKVQKAIVLAGTGDVLPRRWVLKTTTAKSLLRSHPPKKLMKKMSYRSVESMLKRENAAKLYIAANQVESAAWRKSLHQLVSKQDTTAFEVRQTTICWLEAASDSQAPLVYNDDVGALAVVHNELTENMRLLGLTVLLSDFFTSLAGEAASSKAHNSEVLSWWQEADGLVFGLSQDHVSLNIKDVSLDHARRPDFSERSLAAGRSSFWKKLVNRYENQLAIEEDNLIDASARLAAVKIPIRQPVFEYAEEFDG
jgi:hypothetical protein